MSRTVQETRRLISELGRLMFERRLTDSAGGNISARLDDVILITPRQAGSLYRWHLQPDQVLVTDLQGNKIEGRGESSREARVHFRLLNTFYPEGTAVVHGHAMNALVFCAFNQPLPSVLDDTDKFGNLIEVENHPAHSPELADVIVEAMRGEVEHLRKQAAAVLAPRHGVFVLGKDLDTAYDALERIDVNAYCVLMGRLMGWNPP